MDYAVVENITHIEDEVFARSGYNLDLKELFWPDTSDMDCFRALNIPDKSKYDLYEDEEIAVFKYLRNRYPNESYILVDMTRRWKS